MDAEFGFPRVRFFIDDLIKFFEYLFGNNIEAARIAQIKDRKISEIEQLGAEQTTPEQMLELAKKDLADGYEVMGYQFVHEALVQA